MRSERSFNFLKVCSKNLMKAGLIFRIRYLWITLHPHEVYKRPGSCGSYLAPGDKKEFAHSMPNHTPLLICFALVFSCLTPIAWAHPQKASLTDVTLNARTESVEVVHRFVLHDAEQAVQRLNGAGASLLDDPDQLEAFALYVAERVIASTDAGSVELTLLGGEIDDGYVWIYQETGIQPALNSLKLTSKALFDVFPTQQNTVNVRIGGTVRSQTFSNGG